MPITNSTESPPEFKMAEPIWINVYKQVWPGISYYYNPSLR